MTTDPFNIFDSLEKYYPGSRRVRGTARAVPEPVLPGWYDNPQIKRLHGQDVEMFTVGALAKAINKSVYSVRLYEDNGYIPATPYRLPSREINGSTRKGRRLYTRQMIEAVVDIFAANGVLDAPRIEWRDYPNLPREIAEKWRLLQERLSATRPTT